MKTTKGFLIRSLREIKLLKFQFLGFLILSYSNLFSSNSFVESAIQGNLESQLQLGFHYRKGRDKDLLKSYYWMKMAAKQGHPLACRFIAQAHLLGNGTSKNFNLAKKWFILSANQGDAHSMFTLGQSLANEGQLIESAAWHQLAHEYANENSKNVYTKLIKKLDEEDKVKLSERVQKIRITISKFSDPPRSLPLSKSKTNLVNQLVLDNGNSYWGESVHGLPHGYGHKRSSKGSTYQGEFKNGMENGYGTSYNNDGHIIFQGMRKSGKPFTREKIKKEDLKSY